MLCIVCMWSCGGLQTVSAHPPVFPVFVCVFVRVVLCMNCVCCVGVCLPVCIGSAVKSASCVLCYVCLWCDGGLQRVSVSPSFRPVLSEVLSLLCCVYVCGVVCWRVLSYLHCVRGAFGVMYVVLCVYVVLRRPSGSKCSSLCHSCFLLVF